MLAIRNAFNDISITKGSFGAKGDSLNNSYNSHNAFILVGGCPAYADKIVE